MKQRPREQPFQSPPQGRSRLWGWTGFGRKTLWDWLQLLVVPAVLALVGFLLAAAQENIQQQAEESRAQAQRDAEDQRTQDAALQTYLDEMGSMLVDGGLRDSKEGDEVRTLARARTLTVLEGLDPERKGRVLQFLSESDLISKEEPVVDLNDANFQEVSWERASLKDTALSGAVMRYAYMPSADLRGADLARRGPNLSALQAGEDPRDVIDINRGTTFLNGADLRGANLRGANLVGTALVGADLSRHGPQPTDLSNADLRLAAIADANLYEAIVTEEQLSTTGPKLGAIMPDGSKQESP
jgi:hypothetical protein